MVEHKYKFKAGNTTHVIGTKLFPVASKKHILVFKKSDNITLQNITEKQSEYNELFEQLNKHTFHSGKCYSNAQMVKTLGDKVGVKVELYSGWLFLKKQSFPIHHAWNVIDGQYLLDVSLSKVEVALFDELDTSKEGWRDIAVALTKEVRNLNLNTQQDCVFGQPPTGYVYVGSPDTDDNARRIFNDMMARFPNHPSYKFKVDQKGASETQQKLIKEGLLKF